MNQMLLRCRAAVVLACALPALSCRGPNGEDLGLADILCLIQEVSTPEPVTIDEGGTGVVLVSFRASTGCAGILKVTATSANGAIVTVTPEPSVSIVADPNPFASSSDYRTYSARIPLSGLAPGGPIPVSVQVSAISSTTTERTIPVTVVATKGTVNVAITGLPAGGQGRVVLGSVLAPIKTYVLSGSDRYLPNTLPWRAESVTIDGITYDPAPVSGVADVTAGGTANINVVYSPRPAPTTGTANIQIGGVPTGSTGTVTISGPGVNQTVSASGSITLPPGTYTVTAGNVSTSNNDFADPQPMRQVTITAGQTTNVAFVYAIIATLTSLNATGLEAGMTPLVTLTSGSETRTMTANGQAVKLPVGLWTLVFAERIIAYRTYRARAMTATSVNVLAQTSPIAILVAYYCSRWQWETFGTFSIQSDPYGHAALVNLLLLAHRLTVLWQFVEPVAQQSGNVANQVTSETVTITGQGAFVPVTGTRAPNGAITLTGSGTVAGYPNVPAVLTGTLSNTGALTGVSYRFGQTAAPTGLPSGPIIYNLAAPAPTAAMLAPLSNPPR